MQLEITRTFSFLKDTSTLGQIDSPGASKLLSLTRICDIEGSCVQLGLALTPRGPCYFELPARPEGFVAQIIKYITKIVGDLGERAPKGRAGPSRGLRLARHPRIFLCI